MDTIKLGSVTARGGLEIDAMIATACEIQGGTAFQSLITDQDLPQSREWLSQLEKVESEQEPLGMILGHEKKWLQAQVRSASGIKMYFDECIKARSLDPAKRTRDDFSKEYSARLGWTRQVEAKLAAHAFMLEKGRPPTNWSETVPAYLKSAPDVPFSPGETNPARFSARIVL